MSRVAILLRVLPHRDVVPCIDAFLMDPDPLLIESDKRYCLFPIKYPRMYKLWRNAVNSFWNPEEILLKKDLQDWVKLSSDEQFYIKHTLAFFASSDNIVAENIFNRFASEIQVPEIRLFYAMQLSQESIHTVTYNMLIEAYESDVNKRQELFFAIRTHPMIKEKAKWAIRWIKADAPFATRLIAFAIVEMIFFSAAFCSIFWLKKRGIMPGLTLSNEWISRDEALHCEAAWTIYGLLQPENRLTVEDLHQLIREAVNVESQSVRESLPVALIGMNADAMIQYVKYVADKLLIELHAPKLYNASNPFNWMGLIDPPGKVNFFERTNADYTKISRAKIEHTGHPTADEKDRHEEGGREDQSDEKPYISNELNF